jgi:tetratricopeptide (TPR) repeat protein
MNLGRIDSVSDRTLNRLLVWGGGALAVCVLAFSVFYYFDQRIDGGPSMAEREVAAAESAVRENPADIGVRLRLASAYRLDDRPDDARTQYEEVLRASNGHRVALAGLGTLLYAQGDYQGAAPNFQEIVDTGVKGEFAGADTILQESLFYLGSIDLKAGRVDKGIEELNGALKIDRTDSDALYLLGTALVAKGEVEDGIAALRDAVAFVPKGWCDPYQAMADAYSKVEEPAEAEYAAAMVDFCQDRPDQATQRLQALTDGPASVEAMLGLGLVAESQADRDVAAKWYREVLEEDAQNLAASSGLARLEGGPHVPSDASDEGTVAEGRN